MTDKNIVLIGFMGSGKSSLGKLLAHELNLKYIDTDEEIERQNNMEISEIFDTYGEEYFRKLERDYCERISLSGGNVIATGGGIIKNEVNISHLKKNGVIIYIKASKEKILDNIKDDNTRPLLLTDDKSGAIERLLHERTPLYERFGDFCIDVTSLSLEDAFLNLYKTVVLL